VRRSHKILLASALGAIGVVLAVPAVVPLLVDVDRLRGPAEAKLETVLKRHVTLGTLRLSLWTGLALRADRLKIGEPLSGATPGVLQVEAGDTSIHVAWRPLLRREVEVRSIALDDLRVTKDGETLISGVRVSSRLSVGPGGDIEIASLAADVGPVRVAASGRVTDTATAAPRLALSGSARMTRSLVNGRFEILAGPPHPAVSFEVTSPLIDADEIRTAVSALSATGGAPRAARSWIVPEAGAAEPVSGVAPETPATGLEARGSLRADRCVARGLEMTGLSMRVSVVDGVAELRDIALTLYGGTARGTATLRPFDAGLPFSLDQAAEGVAIGPLIAALAPAQAGTVEGTASLAVHLQGDSAHDAWSRTLSGAADLSIVEGAILSVGVVKQMKKALTGAGAAGLDGDKTPFDKLSAHFDIAEGAATTTDLAFRSKSVDGDGTGTVGLSGALNLDVLASFSKGVSAALVARTHALAVRLGADGRLSVPLLVRGTIDAPIIRLDLARVLSDGVMKQLNKEGTKGLLKKLLGR